MKVFEPPVSSNKKIPEIEGIRTIAISMVLAFHFFSRWIPPNYPEKVYPETYEVTRQVSQFGFLGVQLFFMVSGFVILRTLENRSSLKQFFTARFKRIYPSLWLAIPFIYIFCNLLNQVFIAPIPFSSLIPSLSLVSPDFINQICGTNLIWTTGVLWSLFVEIQFYLAAGYLFYNFQKLEFTSKLAFATVLLQSLKILLVVTNSNLESDFDQLLPVHKYLWWFLAGSLFYKGKSNNWNKKHLALILISIAGNLLVLNIEKSEFHFAPIESSITISFYFLFYLVIKEGKMISFLKSPYIVYLGGISYELYLIHESIGVSILSQLNQSKILPSNNLFHLILVCMVISVTVLLSILLRHLSIAITNFLPIRQKPDRNFG